MQRNNLYEEKISSKWWMTGILTAFTAGLLFVLVYQILVGSIGTRPAPNLFFLLMFLLFLGVVINFSRLSIRITHLSVRVSYGIFKHTIPWENIKNCYIDEVSTIRYGGWGIRIGRVKGKCRLVYNVIGAPRVVLSLKKGKFKEFVFSTEKPKEVMNIIRQRRGSDS
ncbi:hypothetical protein KJA16_00100 [Patescibacteria group bacterium]|nr:hypothetical protein [Patescibacteria group bacterium]